MKKVYLTIIAIGLLASCTPIYYMPNSMNVPLIKEKDEIQVSGYTGDASGFKLYGLTSSYAFSNNSAVMFNIAHFSGNDGIDKLWSTNPIEENHNFNPKNQSTMAEFGVGMFKGMRPDSSFIFETYVGYGIYSFNRALDEQLSIAYHIHRPFIQPSIGFRHKYFECAYGLRITHLIFANERPSTAFINDDYAQNEFNIWKNKTRIEHSLTIRVGNERLKAQLQFLSTPSLLYQEYDLTPFNDISNISLGVQFRF
jgi:hypothetical protein